MEVITFSVIRKALQYSVEVSEIVFFGQSVMLEFFTADVFRFADV